MRGVTVANGWANCQTRVLIIGLLATIRRSVYLPNSELDLGNSRN